MTWAYRTILTLISATLVLSILAMVLQPRPQNPPQLQADVSNADEAGPPKGDHWLKRHAEQRLDEALERWRRDPWPETDQAIEEQIDMAFAPVYERIPGLLDRHFSIIGQYAELGHAVLGTLVEEIESRLYAGFLERVVAANEAVTTVMNKEVRKQIEDWIRQESRKVPQGLKTTYEHMLETTVADTVERVSVSAIPTAIAGTSAGAVSASAVALGAKAVAKNMVSIVVKTLAKVSGGIVVAKSGGMVAGAAIGSLLGPVGTIFGGIAGGVATWMAVDGAVVNIAEYLNRDDLERRLTELVDEHKAKVKSDFSKAVYEHKLESLGEFTPSELRSRE